MISVSVVCAFFPSMWWCERQLMMEMNWRELMVKFIHFSEEAARLTVGLSQFKVCL
jgi:hypothetical protein